MFLNLVYGIVSAVFSVMMLLCIIMMYNTCTYADMFNDWYFNAKLIVGTWFGVSMYLIIRTISNRYNVMRTIDLDELGPLVMTISTILVVLYIMANIINNIAGFR